MSTAAAAPADDKVPQSVARHLRVIKSACWPRSVSLFFVDLSLSLISRAGSRPLVLVSPLWCAQCACVGVRGSACGVDASAGECVLTIIMMIIITTIIRIK